jgi:hypothetical protein
MKWIIRGYYKELHAYKFDNLDKNGTIPQKEQTPTIHPK